VVEYLPLEATKTSHLLLPHVINNNMGYVQTLEVMQHQRHLILVPDMKNENWFYKNVQFLLK
jgi:hypothetical protein